MKADASVLIKKDLKIKLAAANITAYGDDASSVSTYPYVTYDLENSTTYGRDTEAFVLYVDGWDDFDRTGSTLALENMMAAVANALDYQQNSSDTKLGFRYALDQRQSIKDTTPNIRRRKYIFEVRAIGKE